MNSTSIDVNLEIAPVDTLFWSGGLDDTTATYLSAATIIPICIWLLWRYRDELNK